MTWKKHFKITNNQAQGHDWGGKSSSAKFSSILPEIYAGHPNRIQRYYQYENMGLDSDVGAALTTIADFCTQSEEQHESPFTIDWAEEPSETQIKVVKQALRQWTKANGFKSKLWQIFRDCAQYGDAFFIRDPETHTWMWVDHFAVEMVKMSQDGKKTPEEYIVRNFDPNITERFGTVVNDMSKYRAAGMAPISSRPQMNASSQFQMAGSERDNRQGRIGNTPVATNVAISAKHMIHLSLNAQMDVNFPFGKSLLDPIFKTFKQKELLEDAIIIYRVQRAPERRVFYIDVGGMNGVRAQAYIEGIKNEIHQRRIPNRSGGGSVLDTTYSPMAILDDYYFAQCLHLDTQIPLLDGRTLTLAEIIAEYKDGKSNYVYSLNKDTHEMEPARISWADVTRKNAEIMRVTLDNGKYVDATPDHPFILRNGDEVEVQNLKVGDSLMPLYTSLSTSGENHSESRYRKYVSNRTGKTEFVHLTVCPQSVGEEVVHHVDFNSLNNNPENLVMIPHDAYMELHQVSDSYSLHQRGNEHEDRKSDAVFGRLVELYNEGYDSTSKLKKVLLNDQVFLEAYVDTNKSDGSVGSYMGDDTLDMIVGHAGYEGWQHFKETYGINHKIVSIELLPYRADTGDITVEGDSNSHVFAIAAGIYVHNSPEGRGSKVEVLPGGDSAGDIGDLSYFNKKMARGMLIPMSYLPMGGDDQPASYNDGKLGQAMIEEFRFNKFCMRIQALLAPSFDKSFKEYLASAGVQIEDSEFELSFNPPQNFTKYRQIEIDMQQTQVYSSVAGNKVMSERFKLMRFLNLTAEEIIENERMWMEENPDAMEAATGATVADSSAEGDLGSVGFGGQNDFNISPIDDFGSEPDMGGSELPAPTAADIGGELT